MALQPYRSSAQNEYLAKVSEYVSESDDWYERRVADGLSFHFKAWQKRPDLVGEYAWAVPNEAALEALCRVSPLIEIGAGSGYWAYLLQQRGADVRPFDRFPPDRCENHYHPQKKIWTKVYYGGPSKARVYPERTLFLCWPPYNKPMAADALRVYRGATVAYIGEHDGGCTADDEFHQMLDRDWDQVALIRLPQYPGIHDRLSIWNRKAR